jgi:hypothetical protein
VDSACSAIWGFPPRSFGRASLLSGLGSDPERNRVCNTFPHRLRAASLWHPSLLFLSMEHSAMVSLMERWHTSTVAIHLLGGAETCSIGTIRVILGSNLFCVFL